MPIELGVSWLSAKAIKVARYVRSAGGKALENSTEEKKPKNPRIRKITDRLGAIRS